METPGQQPEEGEMALPEQAVAEVSSTETAEAVEANEASTPEQNGRSFINKIWEGIKWEPAGAGLFASESVAAAMFAHYALEHSAAGMNPMFPNGELLLPTIFLAATSIAKAGIGAYLVYREGNK